MGYEITRFPDKVDDEFKCGICLNVLEKPVLGPCGHVFCLLCINIWLDSSPNVQIRSPNSMHILTRGTCPVDRKELYKDDLLNASLPFRALIGRLLVECDFEEHGCKAVVKLCNLKQHLKECSFNPDQYIPCQNGCKCSLPSKYDCLKEVKKDVERIMRENRGQLQAIKTRNKIIFALLIVAVVLFCR